MAIFAVRKSVKRAQARRAARIAELDAFAAFCHSGMSASVRDSGWDACSRRWEAAMNAADEEANRLRVRNPTVVHCAVSGCGGVGTGKYASDGALTFPVGWGVTGWGQPKCPAPHEHMVHGKVVEPCPPGCGPVVKGHFNGHYE